ncbi:hypothetical protein VPHF99_0150 [Vibrio phage F99]
MKKLARVVEQISKGLACLLSKGVHTYSIKGVL